MNLTWLSPGWLWLAGVLIVPLLIHLLSRNAGRPLDFAALRFVPRTPLNKLLGIALSQRLLLLLRCLMLLALTLLLAQPRLESGVPDRGTAAVLISPLAMALYPEQALAKAEAEASRLGVAPRILARDFPRPGQSAAPGRPAEAIVAEMHQALGRFDPLAVVIAPGGADRLWRSPPITARIQWLELEPPASAARTIAVLAADDRHDDERYLRAAIETALSAAMVSPWRLLGEDSPQGADVQFALGEVVTDDRAALQIRDTVLPLDAEMQVAVGGQVVRQNYATARTGLADSNALVLLAAEGSPADGGQTLASLAAGEIQFHSRFHPQAGELVSSGGLPVLVRDWLTLAAPSAPRWQPPSAPIAWWPAWVLLGLWLLERLLSQRAVEPGGGRNQ